MSNDKGQAPAPIIIKKKNGHGGGHHGGAWKVAYADFVTAMMALFIVLWIVGQSKEVKESVSKYFTDPVAFSDKAKASGGTGILPEHAPPGAQADLPQVVLMSKKQNGDLKQLEEEKKKIEEIIRKTPAFDKFKEQIEIKVSEEGLRIELVDNSSGLFFDVGSARLKKETIQLLGIVAAEVGKLPNRVSVEGYTDARPYVTENYSNWELSVDRANAARKILAESGLRKGQVQEVRGFADQRLRRPEDPMDFSNRRVSILVPALPAPAAPPHPQVSSEKVKVGG